MDGEIITIDKISLEDAVNFQGMTYRVIRGIYYDEGRCMALKPKIEKYFQARLVKKAEENPIELVYKLLLNSGFGRALMKAFTTDSKFVEDRYCGNDAYLRELKKDRVGNADRIKEVYKLNTFVEGVGHNKPKHTRTVGKYISKYFNSIDQFNFVGELEGQSRFQIRTKKSVHEHFNNAPAGIEILAMSKRIMNEVICTAEDLDIHISYTDTDSIHIQRDRIDELARVYEEKYKRVLRGDQLGQFNNDFKSKKLGKAKEVYAELSIILGKKMYLDVLSNGGDTKEGMLRGQYHVLLWHTWYNTRWCL